MREAENGRLGMMWRFTAREGLIAGARHASHRALCLSPFYWKPDESVRCASSWRAVKRCLRCCQVPRQLQTAPSLIRVSKVRFCNQSRTTKSTSISSITVSMVEKCQKFHVCRRQVVEGGVRGWYRAVRMILKGSSSLCTAPRHHEQAHSSCFEVYSKIGNIHCHDQCFCCW
jgi:hypothetical protein